MRIKTSSIVHRFGPALAVFAVAVTIGVYGVGRSNAATFAAQKEAESGVLTGNAGAGDPTGASAGASIKFGVGTTPTPPPASCPNPRHTPGGSDGAGGCWPGAHNTGYPHGLPGDTRAPVTLAAYTGNCFISASVTIDAKQLNCDVEIRAPASAVITIKNSKINGKIMHDPGDNPTAWPTITIQDTEIDGGTGGNYSTIMFGNYHLTRVNVYGGNHNLYCAYNCTVTDSWVHTPVSTTDSHNNAIFAWGHDMQLTHNSLACDIPTVNNGGCSADLFMKGGFQNATIDRNLLVATTVGGFYYCAYGAQYAPEYNETRESNIIFKDNIFQRGPTGKCGGIVGQPSGWAITSFDPTAPGSSWTNNRWDDGTAVVLQ